MMPGNGGHEHKHGHGGHGMFAKGRFAVMMVVWAVWMAFIAVTMTWFIIILNRVASALKLQARVKVLDDLGDELTAEERAAIVGRVKARALSIY
jgi:hypothetical protein